MWRSKQQLNPQNSHNRSHPFDPSHHASLGELSFSLTHADEFNEISDSFDIPIKDVAITANPLYYLTEMVQKTQRQLVVHCAGRPCPAHPP